MSNSLQPYELQHTRLFCPSLPSGVCSDLCQSISAPVIRGKVIFFWDAEQRVGLSFIISTSLRFYDLFNRGFPRGSNCKESTCQCRRQVTPVWFLGQEYPWRRKWQPTPVFLPQNFRGWRSLAGYSPKELDVTEHACMHLLLFLMASRLARLVPSWLLGHWRNQMKNKISSNKVFWICSWPRQSIQGRVLSSFWWGKSHQAPHNKGMSSWKFLTYNLFTVLIEHSCNFSGPELQSLW